MKKFLSLILSSILLLSACNRTNTEEQTSSISKEPPYLTGTFIQLFGKNDWTTTQWEMFFSELKELKINTVIVQYTAFKNAITILLGLIQLILLLLKRAVIPWRDSLRLHKNKV